MSDTHYERLRAAAVRVLALRCNDAIAELAVLAVEECNAIDDLRETVNGCGNEYTRPRSFTCGPDDLCQYCMNNRDNAIAVLFKESK